MTSESCCLFVTLAQSLARLEDGTLMEGALSLAGSGGGKGNEDSDAAEELILDGLYG